jgi:hypothetical protein
MGPINHRFAVNRPALLSAPDKKSFSRVSPIKTRDFLLGMEQAHRINSADEVYRRAEDAGRLASQRAALADQHERARQAVDRLLRR